MNGLKLANGTTWRSDNEEEFPSILIFSPSRTSHIYWERLRTPWAGSNITDRSYTACIASNPNVNERCCGEQGGTLMSAANFNGTVSTTSYDVPPSPNITDGRAWCLLPGPNYTFSYPQPPPNVVTGFGRCFNESVPEDQNPGVMYDQVTVDSAVYECSLRNEVRGLSGSLVGYWQPVYGTREPWAESAGIRHDFPLATAFSALLLVIMLRFIR